MSHKTILSLLAGIACLSATAADVEMCYSDKSTTPKWWGTGKSETYDVAIRVTDPSLVGAKVTSMKVPFQTVEGVTNITGWLSKELNLVKNPAGSGKVNDPDITSAEMSYANGYLTCTFETPYELTADGVYVGYTFTVPDASVSDACKWPVAVSETTSAPDGLYMHSTKQYLKWRNLATELNMATYITMIADAQFGDVAAGLVVPGNLYYKAGEGFEIPVELVVHGQASLSTLEFAYSFTSANGQKVEGTSIKEFEQPFDVQFGHSAYTEVLIDEELPKDIYNGTLTLVSINGNPNNDSAAQSAVKFETLTVVPRHKPLMEEYGGLWCSWCSRGFVGLEIMGNRHPYDFIGVSYHNGDQMMITNQYPSAVSGFPSAFLDRANTPCDAWFGTSAVPLGVEIDWQAKRQQFTPMAVNVRAWYDADDPDLIRVESDATLVKDAKDDYKISYILVADGLFNPEWGQGNNYAGQISYKDYPEWEKFIYGGSPVYGLTFDDIVVKYAPFSGITGSLPSAMVVDETYQHEYTFRISTCKNIYNENIVENWGDKNKMRVVAYVVNAAGKIVNADMQPVHPTYADMLGVESVNTDATVVATQYYDFTGARVANPTNGLYIKVEVLSDGARRTQKVRIQ